MEKTVNATEVKLWVILPDEDPEMILHPCNLPAAQLIQNRRVSFSGQVLEHHPDSSPIEGITPFNLQEITDGVEGPEEDPC